MRPTTRALLAFILALSAPAGAVAQLSSSVAEMEKERLRKAEEKPIVTFTPEDVAAIRAKRKDDPSLGFQADCAAKKAEACFDLGNHLRNKNGRTPQDAVDELAAYGMACQLNHAESCFKFGEMHEKGMRAARDPKLALNVYGRACKLGFSNGCYSAATLLKSAQAPGAAEQARQTQTVQHLYKAGCDLKHYYSCQAIGIALPEQPGATVAAAIPPASGETATKSAIDVIHVSPGPGHKASDEDGIRLTKLSARIDAAVDAQSQKMAALGYEVQGKSYVVGRYPDQTGNLYKVHLSDRADYVFFAACNELCKNVKMIGWNEDEIDQLLNATNKDSEAPIRWIEYSPPASGVMTIQVVTKCLGGDPGKCAIGDGAGARLVVFRRVRAFDSEGAPPKP